MGRPNIRIIHELFIAVCKNFDMNTVDTLSGKDINNSKSEDRYMVDIAVITLENKSIERNVRNIMLNNWVIKSSPTSRGSM